MPHRCRFISDYIRSKTGVRRTSRQVRSRVQQIGRGKNLYLARIARGRELRGSTDRELGEISHMVSVADKDFSQISSGYQDPRPCTSSNAPHLAPDLGVSPSFHGHHNQSGGWDSALQSLRYEEDVLPGVEVDTRTVALNWVALSTLGSELCAALLPEMEQGLTSQHNGYGNPGTARSLQQQEPPPYQVQDVISSSNAYPAWGYDQYPFNNGTDFSSLAYQYPNMGSFNF
ncbi:hypothetical protein AX15_003834 [Amanita polypyramis BW_CC]|nr:hypothetical protein AX15_003834 [Amanita polypyramis BW_CC]